MLRATDGSGGEIRFEGLNTDVIGTPGNDTIIDFSALNGSDVIKDISGELGNDVITIDGSKGWVKGG